METEGAGNKLQRPVRGGFEVKGEPSSFFFDPSSA